MNDEAAIYLSVGEVARVLEMSEEGVRRRIVDGTLPASRDTGERAHWRLEASDVRAYIMATGGRRDRLIRLAAVVARHADPA